MQIYARETKLFHTYEPEPNFLTDGKNVIK